MIARRLVSTVDLSHDEWLRHRSLGIGSSDAAAAIGMDRYKTARQLYSEKRGEVEPEDLSENEAVELGILLEPVGATLFERRRGAATRSVHALLQHPDHPWMLANLDRRVVGQSALLEVKTAGHFAAMHADWGDPNIEPDRIPTMYSLQVQHQLAVTGYERAYIGVLFAGQRFGVYTVERNDDLIVNLIALEREFWEGVQNGTPPPPQTYAEACKAFPQHIAEPREACPEIVDTVAALRDAKARKKQAASDEETAQRAIALYLGDCDALTDGDATLLTWRSNNMTRLDVDALKEGAPELYARYTRSVSNRTMLLKKGPTT